MRKIFIFLALSIATLVHSQEIRITAASDLRYALDEIIKVYKKDHPKTEIDVSYGSSGQAYTQLMNGAPFDIYFSADINYPRKLKDAGLAIGEPKLYAIGRIVIWSMRLDVGKGMEIFKNKILKIATANPEHAPYGQRAIEALKYYQLYNLVEKQLVYGENISQAAQFCLTGNADVGILALSIVLSPTMSKNGKYFLIPENAHKPLEQAYVMLKRAKLNAAVIDFTKFIEKPEARLIFEKYGFSIPSKYEQTKRDNKTDKNVGINYAR